MTAIAGIIRLDQNPVDRDTVDRMVNQLKIYGRDAQHTHFEQGAAFLRTLLRITPEDSLDRQPLVHPPTRTLLLFDGRLDNREELAEALGIPKQDLNMMADSDVALQACLKWDTAAVDRLLGDFAMACWNPRQRQLWLTRDALGTRPLYWLKQSQFFAFASLPRGLFAIPGIQKVVCKEWVHDHLCLLPTTGPESFYRDIYRVEPGQFLVLEGNTVKTQRYHRWDPEKELRLASDDEYLEAFREQVDRAVACRLRTTGLVASHLSSGFDSSTVTAVASRLLGEQGKPLIAYTAVPREGFNGPVPKGCHGDEGPAAHAVASRFPNIEHQMISTPSISTLDQIRKDVSIFDIPPLNPCNRVWVNAIEESATTRGANIILTGSMGNFSISYTGDEYLPSLLAKGQLLDWWQEILALKLSNNQYRWLYLCKRSFAPFLPPLLWSIWRSINRGQTSSVNEYSSINPDLLQSIHHRKRVNNSGWDLRLQPWINGREKRIALIDRIDNTGDFHIASNALGIERRLPAADKRLIEFCLSMPSSQYLRHGQDRWILRRLMGSVLPPDILSSKTQGRQASDWYENMILGLSAMREELVQQKNMAVDELIDIDHLVTTLNKIPTDDWHSRKIRYEYRYKLLRGISTGLFVRKLNESNLNPG